jgi:hypothetical protein
LHRATLALGHGLFANACRARPHSSSPRQP